MVDNIIKILEVPNVDSELQFSNRSHTLQSTIKDKYSSYIIKKSMDFSKDRKSQVKQFGTFLAIPNDAPQTLSQNQSNLELSSRKISLQSSSRSKNLSFVNYTSDQESTTYLSDTFNSNTLLSKNKSIMENSPCSLISQDDIVFKKLIQDKLNSKIKFEERYGTKISLISDKKTQQKQKLLEDRSKLFYDSYSSQSDSSSTEYTINTAQDDQQVNSLNNISMIKKQGPPLPQIQVKVKQLRSRSVIDSNRLPYIDKQTCQIKEQHILNQRLNIQTVEAEISYPTNNTSVTSPIGKEQPEINQSHSPKKLNQRKFVFSKYNSMLKHQKLDANNRITQDFFKLIASKEESQHVDFIRINRVQVKNYLCSLYDSHSAEILLKFMDYPQISSFQNFLRHIEIITNASNLEICLLSFLLYDINKDGYICSDDLYNRWKKSNNQMGQEDVNEIVRYAKNQLNKSEQMKQTLQLLKVQQEKSVNNKKQIQEEDPLELEKQITSGKKQLKQKGNSVFPDIKSRQYTWYTKCFQVKEHYSNSRQINEEISSLGDQENKQIIKKINFNKISGDFVMNFEHFYEIFRENPPRIVYDMIANLTGYLFDKVNYPYTESNLFQKNIQIIHQQQQTVKNVKQAQNKSNILKQIDQKQSIECYMLQFSDMLTNQ